MICFILLEKGDEPGLCMVHVGLSVFVSCSANELTLRKVNDVALDAGVRSMGCLILLKNQDDRIQNCVAVFCLIT